jgi:rare lipoprotein A
LASWGAIAAIAAFLTGAGAACADESSVKAALGGRILTSAVGVSSYYGPGFHGRPTATGELFDRNGLTAAHKSLPIPCYARVTNLANGRSLVVRINDRGPYIAGRILDVSERVAKLLSYNGGLSRVRLDYLGKAGPAGADDSRALLASLHAGDAPVAVAKAKLPVEDGVSSVARTPALGYAETAKTAPAAAALAAAVRPATPPAPEPLSLAAGLDASVRQLKLAIETTHQAAERTSTAASPFGALIVAPFKPVIEALK